MNLLVLMSLFAATAENVSPLASTDLASVVIPENAVESELAFEPHDEIVEAREYFADGKKVGERYYYESKVLAEEKVFRDGALNGVWRQYHKNGKLFAERPYRDGKPDGMFVFYHDNGKRRGMSVLRNGNGLLRDCENMALGHKNEMIPYRDGVIHGQRTTLGKLEKAVSGREISEYRNGFREGWNVTFRDDGRMYASTYYHRDKLHGVSRKFENGGAMAEKYPKYYVDGNEVSQEEFEGAAATDAILRISLENERPGKISPPKQNVPGQGTL